MPTIQDTITTAAKLLATIDIPDVFDILIVAFLIYWFTGIIRRTGLSRVARMLIILFVSLWLSEILQLTVVNFFINKTLEVGVIAVMIIFQPELRNVLERMGANRVSGLFSGGEVTESMESVITQTVIACTELSRTKTGALIIFTRNNKLESYMNTGTIIDANTSAELLKNIFYPKAPLHDGAVIVRNGRVAAAGCMLPLSASPLLSRDLGMRHRAGIGISEQADSVVVIVSEETGSISVAVEGMLKRNLERDTFEKLLRNELLDDSEAKSGGFFPLQKRNKK